MAAVRLGKHFVGDDDAMAADLIDSAAEIDGVPQDDGVDDEVETGSPVGHGFGDTVAQGEALGSPIIARDLAP